MNNDSTQSQDFGRMELGRMELNLVSHVRDDDTMQLGFRNESGLFVVDIDQQDAVTLMHEAGARLRAAGWASTPEVPEVPRNACLKVVVQRPQGAAGNVRLRRRISLLEWSLALVFVAVCALSVVAIKGEMLKADKQRPGPDLECYNVGGKLMCKAPNGLPKPETKPSAEHSA